MQAVKIVNRSYTLNRASAVYSPIQKQQIGIRKSFRGITVLREQVILKIS